MDDDQIELVKLLCTQVGMIMEDASGAALLSKPEEDLADKVVLLRIATDRALALIIAAQVLCND